jgi:hypothetical protein
VGRRADMSIGKGVSGRGEGRSNGVGMEGE